LISFAGQYHSDKLYMRRLIVDDQYGFVRHFWSLCLAARRHAIA
jgi:hypothetical protein